MNKAASDYTAALLKEHDEHFLADSDSVTVCESYHYVFAEELAQLAFQIIDRFPSVPFNIDASPDTSVFDGAYQEVQFEYRDGHLMLRQSCEYMVLIPGNYENYEEFHEEYPDFSEEWYEENRDEELYILDYGMGSVVKHPPGLGDPVEITREDVEKALEKWS